MFRRGTSGIEVLLVHPGGPYFRGKDAGAWSIPKGEADDGEDLLARAAKEFEEELGMPPPRPPADWISLGSVQQKGGKIVHAWAFEGDLPDEFALASNTFEIEWPPRSGRKESYPEVDKVEFFEIGAAEAKLNSAQTAFLDRLSPALDEQAADEK
jgi:predicted NUDIX family NTP pyrophosphohydrolase